MADKKILVNLDLNKNQILNATIQGVGTDPANPVAGQIYYNTSTKTLKIYDGTIWKDVGIQDIPWGAITGTLADQTDLKNALDNKVDKNTAITGATHTKITYDSKGLVTSGSDLQASDIPNLTLSKITDVTASAAEVNKLDGLNATTAELNKLAGLTTTSTELGYVHGAKSNIQDQIDGVTTTINGFGDVVSHDANEFATAAQGGKADTALQPTDVVNDVVSTDTDKPLSANMGKELQDAITNLSARGRYLSLWNCTTGLPATNPTTSPYTYKTGDYYIVGTVSSSGTNYKPSGDSYTNNVASTAVESGAVLENDTYLYDGTNWILQANAQRTVTFANIAGQPSDNTNLANALALKDNLASPALTGTPTAPTAATGTKTTQIATTAFVADAISTASLTVTAQNPALTPSGGVCTWTVTNTLKNADVICTVKEVSTGDTVCPTIIYGTNSITIKINSASNIAANTYKAVILGQSKA